MENALLRQQPVVASRKVKRPMFKVHERGFVVLLASLLPHWRNTLLLVKPDTVLRWHHQGFQGGNYSESFESGWVTGSESSAYCLPCVLVTCVEIPSMMAVKGERPTAGMVSNRLIASFSLAFACNSASI